MNQTERGMSIIDMKGTSRIRRGLVTLLAGALAGFVFLTVEVLTAADAPMNLKIENKGYNRDKKGAVILSHFKHSADYKIACTQCHHDYQEGENVWQNSDPVKKCIECHNPLRKVGKIMKLQNAYHKNCKDCHKAYLKDHGAANIPLKKCSDCHLKKS
jgi:hypothetical protein